MDSNPFDHRWLRHRISNGILGGALAGILSLISFTVSLRALEVSWTNNLLSVTGTNVPSGKLEVWYLEAFCRSGAHHQDWRKTTLPHQTTLLTNEEQPASPFPHTGRHKRRSLPHSDGWR